MFKKFLCIALSLMMVLCTVSVTGFAASYESADLVASHVTFAESDTADGKTVTASISVQNVSETNSGSAVFWIGKYDSNNVLVESAKEVISLNAKETKTPSVHVSVKTGETDVTVKAYIWEKMVGGKAIATPATYGSDSTEILYATIDGETFADFKADTYTYDVALERTQVPVPAIKLYAKDNSTKITEPATFVVGENKITVESSKGTTKEYTFNLSYKAPEFKNFTASDILKGTYVVNNTNVTKDNFNSIDPDVRRGTQGWHDYPMLNGDGSLNAPGSIGSYLAEFGKKEGELFIFKTNKGPNNNEALYAGGVGKCDGTNDQWFISFDIEHGGTVYIVDNEGKGAPNAVKHGWTLRTGSSRVYEKHFNAGETVKIPSYGWDSSWGAESARSFMNSVFMMFGYDSGWETPAAFDKSDATLKTFEYVIEGSANTVTGFTSSDNGGTYTVKVPYGTDSVSVKAVANVFHATVNLPETAEFDDDGKASLTVTVTSFDKKVTNTFVVNFEYDVPEVDDANLKSLTYKYGSEDFASVPDFDKDTLTYNITLPEKTTSVTVAAVANAKDKATVEITQATIAENKGTATVKVTAEDKVTIKTYTINFTVEKAFDERPNKLVNFKAKENYKTTDHGYQTVAESEGEPGVLVIGENLGVSGNTYYKYHNRKDQGQFKNISSDMVGATYIRTPRNYTGYQDVKTTGTFTRNGVIQQKYHGYNLSENGFRKNDYSTQKFFAGAFSGAGDEEGWMEFNVTSDCTVVIADCAQMGYPNAVKAGWTKVEGTDKNFLGTGESYIKTFKAGDKVKIPNYGMVTDSETVTYKYKDENGADQTYVTNEFNDTLIWDQWLIAIKWDIDKSDNANLSSLKVNGSEILEANKQDYTYYVDGNETSVPLAAVAADAKATVSAPSSIEVGTTANIVVTAEDGTTTKTYTVKVAKKASNNANLKTLTYKVGSGEAKNVANFSEDTLEYTVDAFDYSATPIVVTISGVAVDENATIDTTKATVTLSSVGKQTAEIKVTSADSNETKKYKVTFEMKDLVPTAVVEATDEFKALFNTGKYAGNHVIKLADPVKFTDSTAQLASWDADGNPKFMLYKVTVEGTAMTEYNGSKISYMTAVDLKKQYEEEGKTVTIAPRGYKTGAQGDYDYTYSKVNTPVSSNFNSGFHNFGSMGKTLKSAYQVMTHREIAPGRVGSDYKDSAATKTWLTTSSNYLFKVTPNTKATVYVVMNQARAVEHTQYLADGWTFLDYSAEFTDEKLNALPAEAFLDEYKNLPGSVKRKWYMVNPKYEIEGAPLAFVKVQYDNQSETYASTYPYVWYKTIDANTTLNVPTIGAIAATNDQAPLKAFIVYGEHDSSLNPVAPKSSDATLKSIKLANADLTGFAADKTEYAVELPYGEDVPEVTYETTDAKATASKSVNGKVVTITVIAEDGSTTKTYTITFSNAAAPAVKSNDATLKSLTVGGTPIKLEDAVFEYELTIIDGYVRVAAVANHDAATLVIKNGSDKDQENFYAGDKAVITVTAEDGTTQKVYTVTFKAPEGSIEDGGEDGDKIITNIEGAIVDGGEV